MLILKISGIQIWLKPCQSLWPIKHFGTIFASICVDYALFWCYLGQIFIQSGANLASKLKKEAGIAPSNGAIWDEFSE